ncbi:hypothetical protein LGL55_06925 [Clostridium tagluense]|uniref:hypothetical protein n=1 Tax=Clostridium tagluense TaxID=360422 RepID=UPI001C6DFB32|nr:hypothetical protein [Clostridium tagluense]MBW9157268.1 hypothetical protein [Clostridium tagluense]MCB2310940.1 hypothetical protein [Clostridium tagluense]MCB2315794.1 hypothetical protein [Clostridium tagluense]MCB2320562.1 hypothetical protein [Clostridium tagluense]MCB2325533.1 hypothetical protein [Clostridium tagluense]
MVKKKPVINLALILSLCLNFMIVFVNRPKSVVFSILYDLIMLIVLIATMLLLHMQVKASMKK